MQLILGLSKNNFIAKSDKDDMKWLKADKNIFRLLSATNKGINYISKKSGQFMPDFLPGRQIIKLTRKGLTLDMAFILNPQANLIGGQTLAKIAILRDYISDCFITYAPIKLEKGIKFNLDELINKNFNLAQKITIDKIIVKHWKLK